MFRVYETQLHVNEFYIERIWIDPHYEKNHRESINDQIICELVSLLDGKIWNPSTQQPNGFQFFESNLILNEKPYRMIWVLPPDHSYLGVRNAYRKRLR